NSASGGEGRSRNRMFKGNKKWSALAAAALGALGITVLVSGPASAAPVPPPLPVVQVAAASDVPVNVQGETFHTFTANVFMGPTSDPYLTGSANADGPIYVDDVLQMKICGAQSQTCTYWRHDFSNGCTAPGPQPIGPIFFGQFLNRGLNTITFTLSDQCGQHEGSSDIYLTGNGVIEPTPVTSNECKGNLSKWIGG